MSKLVERLHRREDQSILELNFSFELLHNSD